MTDNEKEQIKKQAEFNIKMELYKQPAFPYFQSLGLKEFFYPVQSNNEVIGFLHIWWNKDKSSGIVQGGKEARGFWETVWYDTAEEKPDIFGKSIIDKAKLIKVLQQKETSRMEKIALLQRQAEKLQKLQQPSGILKKYLS